jgi:peptidyl-prolyl cis-trans isomerase D
LEKAVFGLKKGDISQIVESPLGLHILRLEDFREARTRTLKEARAEIAAEIARERGRSEAAKAAEEDRDKALAGTEFSALANARNLNAGISPLFARSDPLPEVGAVPDFYEAAFSLSFKQVSAPVQGPDAYFLVKLKDRKEPAIPSFESVRPRLEKDLRDKKALDLAVQKANGLLAQLKKGKSITALAAESQLKLEETGWFQRNTPELPKIGALQEAKTGGVKLSAYQPIPDQVYTRNDAVYILALKDSRAADVDFFHKEKIRLQEQALAQKKQQVLKKYMDGLKARARINVNPAFLEPL